MCAVGVHLPIVEQELQRADVVLENVLGGGVHQAFGAELVHNSSLVPVEFTLQKLQIEIKLVSVSVSVRF